MTEQENKPAGWAEKINPAKAGDDDLVKNALAVLEGFTPDIEGMIAELFHSEKAA